VNQDHTYHVDRSRFDLLLLQHAMALGSRVMQGVSAKEVVFDGSRAVGVLAEGKEGALMFDASIVVDATGRETLLGRQLRCKQTDPIFNQFAVHAWFKDVNRGQGRTRDYIHIYFLPVERGWAWQIPISETTTSVGIVTEREVFRESKGDSAGFFEGLVNTNINLAEAMAPAHRCNDFKSEGNYSYSLEQFAGDGFVIVGDAGRFVDPIFSSGVNVAMHGAKFASDVIMKAIEDQAFSRDTFAPFEKRMRNGVKIWYDFIRLYYKLLPGFTRFIQDRRYRLDVLRLLQGDVYDQASVPVLDAMRSFIHSVEADPNHLLHGSLSDVPID
jgi:1H-pyrrole-2-carbonyl-[peptidyl-carrier protein] chlorinase